MTHNRRTDRVRDAIGTAYAHQNSDSWEGPVTSRCAAELGLLLVNPPAQRCAHLGRELQAPWYIDASDPFRVVRCSECVDPQVLAELTGAWADPLPQIGRCCCCGDVDVLTGIGILRTPISLGTVISALCEECGSPPARRSA